MKLNAKFITRIAAAIAARTPSGSYSINVPGEGLTGSFATVADAENAMRRLPPAARIGATICDQDGMCLAR